MPVAQLTTTERDVVKALAGRASLAATLLEAWAALPQASPQTAQSLVKIAHLGVTEERGAAEILTALSKIGVVRQSATEFVPTGKHHGAFAELARALYAIAFYQQNVHRDASSATVVLTKPPRPNLLEEKLANLGWRTGDLEPTDRAFYGIVQRARERVVVMTPFFDAKGAQWLQELFSKVRKGARRILVLRSLEDPKRVDYPTGYSAIVSWLSSERIEVFNYSIPRPSNAGRETFHAKVVLCDSQAAYVGSSNLNAASMEYSMELGVVVTGKAARDVALVVEAVLEAATEFA